MKPTVAKGSIEETDVLPLCGRCRANRMYPELFHDTRAAEILDRIDYTVTPSKGGDVLDLVYGIRQEVMAYAVRRYLSDHPDATILNLGCGLDDTFEYVDNGVCTCIELDRPEVLHLRVEACGLNEREACIGCDLEDVSWMDRVSGGHVFAFSGGVLMYLHPEAVARIIRSMAERFPGGGMIFNYQNRRSARMTDVMVRSTGNDSAPILFWMDDPETEIRAMSDRIASVEVTSTLPGMFSSLPQDRKDAVNLLMERGNLRFVEIRFAS